MSAFGLPNAFMLLLFWLFLLHSSPHRGNPCKLEDDILTMNNESLKNHSNTFLALGDSYTIGESVSRKESFPYQTMYKLVAAGLAMSEPDIFAVTGWTTGDLLKAISKIDEGKKYDIVSLLIGVNNQYQGRSPEEYANEFGVLLEKAVHFASGGPAQVFVLSIPDYSGTPFASSMDKRAIAEKIDQLNRINKGISLDRGVHYIDITSESRKSGQDPSLIAEDGLHFSGKEYFIWADLLASAIHPILKSQV